MAPVLINEGFNGIDVLSVCHLVMTMRSLSEVSMDIRVYQVHQIVLSTKYSCSSPRAYRELHFLTLLRLNVGL